MRYKEISLEKIYVYLVTNMFRISQIVIYLFNEYCFVKYLILHILKFTHIKPID